MEGNYLTVYSLIGIVLISLFCSVVRPPKFNSFSQFWILLLLWVLFEYLIGRTGHEAGNIFRMSFCPFTFLALYQVVRNDPQFIKTIVFAFLIIYLDNSYLFFKYTLFSDFNVNNLQSNYIFWPFCIAPFIFLVDKKILKWALLILLVVMSIISMKRSVVIALLFLVPFLFNIKKLPISRIVLALAVIVIVGGVMNNYLTDYIGLLDTRMRMTLEDEGSGRIPIFIIVWKGITSLDISDLVFGRGFGKISETGFSNAHNDFLQTIYEYGIVGLALYVILLVKIIKKSRSVKIKNTFFSTGYSFTVIICIVMGLVSNLTVSFSFFIYLCAFWGIVEGYTNAQNYSICERKNISDV